MMELIDKYLSANNYNSPVLKYCSNEDLANDMDFSLPDSAGGYDKVFSMIEKYMEYCVKTGHPQFFNQLWSGFNLAGFLGEILTALTNTSMHTYAAAPVATLVELSIIKKLLNIFGFPEKGMGTFVTGGSNGNFLGMLLARDRALSSGEKLENLCAFISENAHYSVETAAKTLGVSSVNIFKIKCDENQKTCIEQLNIKMQEAINSKKIPFFICVTFGTTVAGVFDSISNIYEITKQYNQCWLHVDAALGGCAIFSDKYNYLLKDSCLADSIVFDAHKLIGAPVICSIFLVKDECALNFHETNVNANDYLFHDEKHNLGIYSLQCGRRADALKLWLMWHNEGTRGFGEKIETLVSLASYAEKKITSTNELTLSTKREFVTVCFYYKLKNPLIAHDDFHNKIKHTLYTTGITMVNTARINNQVCIRLVISNPTLHKNDIDIFFNNFLNAANKLRLSLDETNLR